MEASLASAAVENGEFLKHFLTHTPSSVSEVTDTALFGIDEGLKVLRRRPFIRTEPEFEILTEPPPVAVSIFRIRW